MPDASIRLDVSIHDVMPDTLNRVTSLAQRMDRHGLPKATLLVVPGAGWKAAGVMRLQQLASAGHPLAGHGWIHRAGRVSGLYHRLHSRLISGQVAEHLGLGPHGIMALMRGCHKWFAAHDLPEPERYVPPAWAMGRIPRQVLPAMPFRYFEYTRGVYDAHTGHLTLWPLIGFEARSTLQALALRGWNRANEFGAHRVGRLRIAVHPYDDELALRGDLSRTLAHWGAVTAAAPSLAPA